MYGINLRALLLHQGLQLRQNQCLESRDVEGLHVASPYAAGHGDEMIEGCRLHDAAVALRVLVSVVIEVCYLGVSEAEGVGHDLFHLLREHQRVPDGVCAELMVFVEVTFRGFRSEEGEGAADGVETTGHDSAALGVEAVIHMNGLLSLLLAHALVHRRIVGDVELEAGAQLVRDAPAPCGTLFAIGAEALLSEVFLQSLKLSVRFLAECGCGGCSQ